MFPGAITTVELRGYSHYVAFAGREFVLVGNPGTKLPAWFLDHSWSRPVTLVTTGVFSDGDKATSMLQFDEVELDVATPEQPAFEKRYLVPKRQSHEEAVGVVESLTSLRPQIVQQLLENCTSVKTRRLFIHAAERLNHPWLKRLDLSKIDFGSGRRTVQPRGRLDHKNHLIFAGPIQGQVHRWR